MFEIRKAVKSDAIAIRRLIWLVGINPLGLDWHRFIVAVDHHKKMIGCAQLKQHRDGSLELASVAVRRDYRSQGIAGTMIRHLMKKQKPAVYLTCRQRLTGYYERFGFVTLQEYRDLPQYFKRVGQFSHIFAAIFKPKDGLAIMVCRKCDPSL